jgi:hypothetical protein
MCRHSGTPDISFKRCRFLALLFVVKLDNDSERDNDVTNSIQSPRDGHAARAGRACGVRGREAAGAGALCGNRTRFAGRLADGAAIVGLSESTEARRQRTGAV